MDWIFLFQAVDLLACIAWHATAALLALPLILLRNATHAAATGSNSRPAPGAGTETDKHEGNELDPSCAYYEGIVTHVRRAPVENKFKYPVRTAVISLDRPPAWFKRQGEDHMTADQARQYAGTDGKVLLLTTPSSAGYIQNPISVYYCHDSKGALSRCIAEVTNTPWNERVTFVFDPKGASVKKALHVSPFMDMKGTWLLEAPAPGPTLRLVVRVKHPEYGAFFDADLAALRSSQPGTGSEDGGWAMLWRYGFQPHRVAIWIYWQALVLLFKGMPLQGLPSQSVKEAAADNATHVRDGLRGAYFTWREAPRWPWNAQPPACDAATAASNLVAGNGPLNCKSNGTAQ